MSLALKRRPDWDEYHILQAIFAAARSTCLGRNIGSVLVAPNGVDPIQISYNGTPEGYKNCDEGGCPRCLGKIDGKVKAGESYGMCICEHAEANVLGRAAMRGVPTAGTVIYTTVQTCGLCLKEAVAHGVKRVVFLADLKNDDPLRELISAVDDIKIEKYSGKMSGIEKARKLVKVEYGRELY